jgi:hypothetical protein
MRNRISISFVLAIVTILVSGALLHGQTTTGKKLFGYQDSSGGFHPMLTAVPDATTTPATAGTIQLTLTITVKSTFPSGTTRTIVCGIGVDVTGMTASGGMTSYMEAANANATGSGTAYTCTLKIPYSWIIPTTVIQKSLLGSYTVQVNNSTMSAGPAVLRLSEGTFLSTPTIPANGATSTYTVAVTI